MDGKANQIIKNSVSHSKPSLQSFSSWHVWYIISQIGLIACNLIQGGIYEGLMCWGVFFCLAILHYLNFKDTDAKKRAVGDCVFYAILLAWFVGTLVHYGFMYT